MDKIKYSPQLSTLDESRIKPAAEMLARSLHDDPMFIFFFPNPEERRVKTCLIMEFTLRNNLNYGEVYTTGSNPDGLITWRYSNRNITIWKIVRTGGLSMLFRFNLTVLKRLLNFTVQVERKHKRLVPFSHFYIDALGVDPACQGKGHGGNLLRAALAEMAASGLPCYLETTNESNVSFYEHHGFTVLEKFIVKGTSSPVWTMIRRKPE